MALTVRVNGTGTSSLITEDWFNDFLKLFTGVMVDQPITFKPNTTLRAIAAAPGAPTLTLATGSALGVGTYKYGATLVTADGGETALGTIATITTTSGNQAVDLSAIPTDATGAAVSRNLYRTKVGGSTFFLLHNIANNTTTTYSDAATDASLPTTQPPASSTFGGSLISKDSGGTIRKIIYHDGTSATFHAGVVLTGATAGTATLYQIERGTWKEIFIFLSGFRNISGSTQTVQIPVPFTQFVRVETCDLFQIALQVGNTAQNIKILTSLLTAGGGTSTQTNIAGNSIGTCQAAIDTIGFLSGGSGSVTSVIYLRGV